VPGSHTYAGKNPARNERLGIHVVFKRKKLIDDISKMGKYKNCIQKSRIMV